MAKSCLDACGCEYAADGPGIFDDPDDNLRNVLFEAGLQGKTTTFVHNYRTPE
jgi:hypothetical protein